jgi:alcohol dehydrogenase class IV
VHGWPTPRLSQQGLRVSDFPELIRAAQASSSMKGNPVRLTDEVLSQVLAEAY